MRLNRDDKEAFVRAVMQDVPSEDFQAQAAELVNDYFKAKAPKDVVAFDKKYPGKLKTHYISGRYISGYHTVFAEDTCYNIDSSHPDLWEQVKAVEEKRDEQRQRMRDLEARVRGMIEACNTLKQAKERLPEFEKYLPKDRGAAGTADLPVANVVAELSKAGWPKGKKLEVVKP